MRTRRHPQSRDWLRWAFVKVGVVGLVAIFVAILTVAAAALALGLALDSPRSGNGFLALWKDEFMALLNLPVEAPPANTGGGLSQVVSVAGGLIAVVVPALYIGAMVFRVFAVHPKTFVFRRQIALQASPDTFTGELEEDGHVLAIRVYNASRLQALDVRFDVIHQHWYGTGPGSIVRNLPAPVANPGWPMADRHVPYTLFVRLTPGDVVSTDDGRLELAAIGGKAVEPEDRLVVHASGVVPQLGESFVERHAFDLRRSVSDEGYGGIDIEYGSDSKRWPGWERFDA